MCGITGICNVTGIIEPQLIKQMTTVLKHRGPDDEGYIGIDTKNDVVYELYSSDSQIKKRENIASFNQIVNILFGHRRLAVIDLSSSGHQPMSYDDEKLWIVYNGEIYNYVELRNELKAKGYEFKTDTDTEIILASYKEWRDNCTTYFNGDWAFAIYDREKNIIFLSRDRFGIKPLYYFHNPELKIFAFASEIKALYQLPYVDKKIDKEKCFDFLVYDLLEHSEKTMYKNIFQIEPGNNLILQLNSIQLKMQRYYKTQCNIEIGNYNHTKALSYANDIRDLLIDAVKLRLRADVPIGTCLSGGVDSSSIVLIINKLLKEEGIASVQIGEKQKTFTASFLNESVDETAFAVLINKQIEAKTHLVNFYIEDLDKELDDLLYFQEEPFSGMSIYAQWKVMEEAGKHVKVLLDGQGGDEVFGGYTYYRSAYLAQLIKNNKIVKFFAELFSTFEMYNSVYDAISDLKTLPIYIIPPSLKKFFYLIRKRRLIKFGLDKLQMDNITIPTEFISSFVPNLNIVLSDSLMKYSLPHLLRYEDKNSMAFSIESRTPFTDYRLVNYVFSIPSIYKVYNGWSKWLLRLAMKNILPDKILWRKDKIGFAVPNSFNKKYPRSEIFNRWFSIL